MGGRRKRKKDFNRAVDNYEKESLCVFGSDSSATIMRPQRPWLVTLTPNHHCVAATQHQVNNKAAKEELLCYLLSRRRTATYYVQSRHVTTTSRANPCLASPAVPLTRSVWTSWQHTSATQDVPAVPNSKDTGPREPKQQQQQLKHYGFSPVKRGGIFLRSPPTPPT